MKLFYCVARHPLLLSGLGTSLYDVPSVLRPTILLYQPGRSPLVKRLHAASHLRGFPVARHGSVEDLFGPKIMYLGDRNLKGTAADAAISMALSPASPGTAVLTDQLEASLANNFQAKMLRYRIDNFKKVRCSDFDAPEFSGSVRVLARFLGSCVPGDRDLQRDVLRLLGGMDEASRAALAMRPESVLVEALLTLCHEKRALYMSETSPTPSTASLRTAARPSRSLRERLAQRSRHWGCLPNATPTGMPSGSRTRSVDKCISWLKASQCLRFCKGR